MTSACIKLQANTFCYYWHWHYWYSVVPYRMQRHTSSAQAYLFVQAGRSVCPFGQMYLGYRLWSRLSWLLLSKRCCLEPPPQNSAHLRSALKEPVTTRDFIDMNIQHYFLHVRSSCFCMYANVICLIEYGNLTLKSARWRSFKKKKKCFSCYLFYILQLNFFHTVHTMYITACSMNPTKVLEL